MMIYYSFGLLLLFFLFLVVEFFVPSAGLIGVAAAITAIATIVCAFMHSTMLGLTMTGIIIASTPAILYFMIRLWPHTPIGRRILNRRPGQTMSPGPERTMRDGTPFSELVGQIGVAKSDLLPSGLVVIDGKKMDAISLGMAIDAGTKVIVVKISSGKIQVRPANEQEQASRGESPVSPQRLDSPLESFDLESLE